MLKNVLRNIPVIGPALVGTPEKKMPAQKARPQFASGQYWEDRYKSGRNSGAGSYNRLAAFKAAIINDFVKETGVTSVGELGCGDGAQLELAKYPAYIGYDVSRSVIELTAEKFKGDDTKRFEVLDDTTTIQPVELSMSLDVIYHLVEDDVFELYMARLFDMASKYVIVYASDHDEQTKSVHVRHRHFTKWVAENRPNFSLFRKILNAYPSNAADPDNTSFADFYIFRRNGDN